MYDQTAHFYGLFEEGATETEKRVRFVSSFLQAESQRILDIGAGNGEMAFRLGKMGHHVFCLEPSPSMHALLLERLSSRHDLHRNVSVYPCQIEELNHSVQADLAYASSVFSHLDFPSRVSLMHSLKTHLKKEGLFVFNAVRRLPERASKPLTLLKEKTLGDVTYRHFDSADQIAPDKRKVIWRFETESALHGRHVFEESFLLHLDDVHSIQSLMDAAGFEQVDQFGSWSTDDLETTKPDWVIVAGGR